MYGHEDQDTYLPILVCLRDALEIMAHCDNNYESTE